MLGQREGGRGRYLRKEGDSLSSGFLVCPPRQIGGGGVVRHVHCDQSADAEGAQGG